MKFRLFSILTLSVTLAFGQTKKMSLQECVEYALENNLTIEQFELDLESAELGELEGLGQFLPRLNGSMGVNESKGFGIDPRTNTANPSLVVLQGNLNLSVGYTLFDGLRNLRRAQRAEMNTISNQYRLANLKDDIRLRVANAYLNVISSKESLKVAQAQYGVTEQDMNRIKELVELGVVPTGDLLEIEATAANQEQAVVNAEARVILARINLAQLLQITDYENFDIADEAFDVPSSTILDKSPKQIFTKAMSFRNDIKLAETSVVLSEQDLKIAKGAALPTLNAFMNYNTFASDRFQIDDTGNLVRPDLIAQLEGNDGVSYGLSLNIPIFNAFSTSNSIKRAALNVKRSELQYEQTKLDLENAVNQAYNDVKTFAKTYEAAQKTLDARRLAYNYAKERFEVGLMNSFDFSQAQSRLDNAEASVIRAKYDYIFRLKILEFYFGIPIAVVD
ncbi:MAG: TolC family protein [Flavobacteriaceae bacterium]|nr:TolC family protein [Flavobacteriaceae bacterium]